MIISECITYLKNITSKDAFQILNDLNGNIATWSDQSHIPELVFGIVGVVLALVIGLVGYKLIRPTMSLVMACAGFLVGDQLFRVMDAKWEWMPNWLAWLFAIVVALIFASLAFARASYALSLVAGLGGYCTVLFYIDNQILAIGGAMVAAIVVSYLVRTSYVLLTGLAGGLLTVSFLSVIFPKVEQFELGIEEPVALVIAGCVALVFILTQFATNRYRGERLC